MAYEELFTFLEENYLFVAAILIIGVFYIVHMWKKAKEKKEEVKKKEKELIELRKKENGDITETNGFHDIYLEPEFAKTNIIPVDSASHLRKRKADLEKELEETQDLLLKAKQRYEQAKVDAKSCLKLGYELKDKKRTLEEDIEYYTEKIEREQSERRNKE